MANTDITRYDFETDGNEIRSQHPQGDYVTFDDQLEIVTVLQDELAANKRKVEQALSYLNEIG